jgi:hypothetical protein
LLHKSIYCGIVEFSVNTLPNEQRPHSYGDTHQHHSHDDVPRRMDAVSFSDKLANMLFPGPLLALSLLQMVFVMLLLVVHDFVPFDEGWPHMTRPSYTEKTVPRQQKGGRPCLQD